MKMLLLGLAAAACIAALSGRCSAVETDNHLTIANDHAAIQLDNTGVCTALTHLASGTNFLARPEPLLKLAVSEGLLSPLSVEESGGAYRFTFPGNRQITLGITPSAGYFVLKVLSASAADAVHLEILPLELTAPAPQTLAACTLALNLQVNVEPFPGANRKLQAHAYQKFGLQGAKLALAACPPDILRQTLQQIVTSDLELPHSSIGGPFALDAPINRGSYVFNFSNLSEETVDDWIALAKALGFTQIDFHGGNSFRFGDVRPNPETYPNGRASLKAVIDRLHAAGIQAGLHTYAFFIDKGAKWVTPVPDPRLAKDAIFTLADDLPADASAVPVLESTADMSTITGFFVRNSVTLQIDDELIVYTGISKEEPYGFTGCQRGAYGTQVTAHAKGAKVGHLKECFGLFVPDPETTLFEEVAAATAETFNECGFDMIYLDALDGEDILGGPEWGWHYGSRFVFEIWKRLQRPALQEMSTFHHHLWYVRSRAGAWDHPVRSHKRFIDLHMQSNRSYEKMFLPGELGWWAVKTWGGAQTEPTFTDDIEYLCTRAIGADVGLALMGVDPANIKANPTLARLAEIFRNYENLRHSGTFSQGLRQQMALPRREFTLVTSEDAGPAVKPASYWKHKFTSADPHSAEWAVENPYEEQIPFLRIEALLSCASYDSPEALTLTDFTGDVVLPERHAAPGISASLEASASGGRDGGPSGVFAGRIDSPQPGEAAQYSPTEHGVRTGGAGGWATFLSQHETPLNLGERQALGVWVKGDASGSLLNFQLRSPDHLSHGIADHYVDIDFRGWRYFELLEPEGERIDDYGWPYTSNMYALYRELVRFDSVDRFSIWLNSLPSEQQARIVVSPVKALPLVNITLKNPAVTINGRTVTFPVDMPSGSYLEFRSIEDCRLYGPGGELLQEVKPEGDAPKMKSGENTLSFRSGVEPEASARARITTGAFGPPMR